MKINTSWNTNLNENCERIEIYNFNNKEDFMKFKAATENNDDLLQCFTDSTEDFNTSCDKWMFILNNLIKKSFKRIRINHKKSPNLPLDNLFKLKESLKSKIYECNSNNDLEGSLDAEDKLEKVDEDIADLISAKNKKIVEDHL